MKTSRLALFCLCILLIFTACTSPSNEQTITPTPTFAIPKNNVEILSPEEFEAANGQKQAGGGEGIRPDIHEMPVFQTGATWDRRLINAAVFYYSGNFYMAYTAAEDWRSSFHVGAASSDDGLNWEQRSSAPRLSPQDVPGGAYSVYASSILIGDDSGRVAQWALYYSTNENNTQQRGAIGRATAVDPNAPWTLDEELALLPGESGEWDDGSLAHPNVLKTTDGYIMYYSGFSRDGESAIGMAASTDGITWRKYDNPETTDAPYADSDPILSSEPGWGGAHLHIVRVLQRGQNDWRMAFLEISGEGQPNSVGYALSSDGIHWLPAEGNPVVTADGIPDGVVILDIDLVASEDMLYLFMVGVKSDDSSAVYVATLPW